MQREGKWDFQQLYWSCGTNKMKVSFVFLAGLRMRGLKSSFWRVRVRSSGWSLQTPSEAPGPAAGAVLPYNQQSAASVFGGTPKLVPWRRN